MKTYVFFIKLLFENVLLSAINKFLEHVLVHLGFWQIEWPIKAALFSKSEFHQAALP